MVIGGTCSLLMGKVWEALGSKFIFWAVGAWNLDVQRAALLRMLAPWPGGTARDEGGGHGRFAGLTRVFGSPVMIRAERSSR